METVLPPCSARQECTKTTTSLYELIEALQHEFGPENDDLVVATIVHLLRSKRVRFLHDLGESHRN